ncbi:uncharacterized protein LOC133531054 [Cydia pomonella]|uniref:uncharacterized protein LOC133531054 n=1 Tax=Cydia pomonella TaxID=82600 RepID=UPI002ADE471C|nr:uncharacterized protein LOC133531054 [Cydia pomonella]
MKEIFLIFVAILWYIVESAKIRATRRQWIQYQPPNRNIFPVQNQYFNWQYPNQKFPIYPKSKLVYSYINPLGERFNMYGVNKGNIGAYTAYLNGQFANRGQNMYQNWPGSRQTAWWVNRGLIGQAGYQNWLNSFGTPIVYKNLVGTRTFYNNLANGGHDLNLSINRNDNSESKGQDDSDIDIRNSAPNPEQVNYSVKHNIQNEENESQKNTFFAKSGVYGKQKTQFNINKEESGSFFSVTDHNAISLANIDVYDLDQNKLDVANEASLQDVASEVSTENVENISNSILTEDETQNWADETHSENTVTIGGWNSDNVKNDLTSDNEDIITDVEADNEDNTGTESYMAENLISTGHKSSVDRNGLNVADARLQKQFKEVGRSIDLTALLQNWSPLPHRNLYPANQNNLNWVSNYPFLVNGHNRMNVKPFRVQPFGWPPNQQQMIRYNMPWNGFYGNYQQPRPTHPNFIPRFTKWILPLREKQNWANAIHSDNTVTVSGLNSDDVKEIHDDNEESVHPVTLIPENDFTSANNEDTITDEVDNKDNGTVIVSDTNSDNVKEIHADNEESVHPVTVIPENDLVSPDNEDINTDVEEGNKDNTGTESIMSENIITTDDKSTVDRSGLYEADVRLQNIISSREIISPEQVNNLVPRICFNPNVINIKPGYERFTSAKARLNTFLKMLQMFGIRHLPRYIYKNVPSQNLDMEYDLDERRPFDFDYAEDAVQPSLYRKFPFLYQRPRKVINFPGRFNRYRQSYADARELDIESAILRPNETPSNDANNANEIYFKLPESHFFKHNHIAKHDYDTKNHVGSLLTINLENMMRDELNTPEASEKYVRQLIVDIVADLVRFPSSNKCHSENITKLLEGIKDIVDALKSEQC